MRKVTKTVQAELVEYTCSKCRTGVLRATDHHAEDDEKWLDSAVIANHPTLYEMKCSNCGQMAKISQPYPVLRYQLHDFVLKKHSGGKIEALRRLLRRILSMK